MRLESTVYDSAGRVVGHTMVMLATEPPVLLGPWYPALTTAWNNAEDAAAFDGDGKEKTTT